MQKTENFCVSSNSSDSEQRHRYQLANMEKRIERLRQSMDKNNFDAIVILSDENRRYLSGFTGEDGNYDECAGILIITKRDLLLATDSRYQLQAASEATRFKIHCYEKGLAAELPEMVIQARVSDGSARRYRVALETSRITFDLYSKFEKKILEISSEVDLLPADDLLKNFRIIKDQDEVTSIRASLKIVENAFLQLKKLIAPEMTEKEAAWQLEKLIREKGGDSLSFPVIAASGPNSALPHAIPGDRRLKKGEPLLFDFGARLNGYCSDISRTLSIGSADTTFEEAYEILFNGQKKAVEAIRPGIKCSEIDLVARGYIDSSKFSGRFGHALGHGVGIAIHEPPRLSRLDDTPLAAGMVVTVEPGIYIPEWGGIRLENMVIVTEDGAQVLNTLGYDDYIL